MKQRKVTSRYRGYLAAVCIVVVATVVSSCSSSGSGKSPGSSAQSGTKGAITTGSSASATGDGVDAARAAVAKYSAEVTQFPTIPPITGGVSDLKGKTLWYIPLGASLPIFQGFGAGVQQAAQSAGLNYHTCDGKLVPTTIVSCLNQAASQGAAGVVAAYIGYDEAATAYDNLIAHHIPVLLAGEPAAGGKSNSPQIAFYNSVSDNNLSMELAFYPVIADSAGKAKILFMGVTDSVTTKNEADYAQAWIRTACPGCELTRVDYNSASLDKLSSLVSSALISHPDTNYVVCEVDSAEPSVITGIQSAGYAGKVKITAVSGTLPALQLIKQGKQLADVGGSPILAGYAWTDDVLRMMKGQNPVFLPAQFRIFTQQNVGPLTLTPAAYTSNAWYGPDTFVDLFKKAWGIG